MHKSEREGEVYIGVWLGKLSERDHLEQRRKWEDNIKTDLKINHLVERGRGSG